MGGGLRGGIRLGRGILHHLCVANLSRFSPSADQQPLPHILMLYLRQASHKRFRNSIQGRQTYVYLRGLLEASSPKPLHLFSATSSHSIPAFCLRLHLHERIALSKCRRRLSISGLPPMALLSMALVILRWPCVSRDADMRVATLTPQLLTPMIVFASIDQT